MKCIERRTIGCKVVSDVRKDIVEAFILSDSVPATLPTDGTNVDGMTANEVFAPFSMIYVVSTGAVYVAKEDGTFALMQ